MVRRMLPSILLAALAGCLEAPINWNDGIGVPDPLNSVTGTLVFGGDDKAPIGPTFVTVFDAANPGPPAGTGGPVTFSSVPADDYTDAEAGLRSAPYGVPGLADGTYLVNGLMDVDRDFNPFVGVLAGATCGDWVGTHLGSLSSTTPAAVPVEGGELRDGVTVLLGQQMTTERPAFVFGTDDGAGPIISLAGAVNPYAPVTFSLAAADIGAAFSADLVVDLGPECLPGKSLACTVGSYCGCDLPALAAEPCSTSLLVLVVDADGNTFPDPYPDPVLAAAGLLDVWPRVFLESLDDSLGVFTYEGEEYEERWVAQAHPLAAEFGAVAAKLAPPDILPPVGLPVPSAQLSTTFVPAFRHYHADGAMGVDVNGPFDLVNLLDPSADASQVPTGAWAVTVVSITGQTWTLPNEVGALGLPALPDSPDFDALPQASAVVLTP